MAENFASSPLRRAKAGAELWLDLLPEDSKLDARMALDEFYQTAEREIASAYNDGSKHNWNGRRVDDARKAQIAAKAERS